MVEDKPIFAHKAILATQSEHFRAMFTGGMKESYSAEAPGRLDLA